MDRKVVAFLLSALFLYLAGVLTGAYLGSMTAFDITRPLQWKTIQLEGKVSSLEKDLSSAVSYLFLLVLLEDKNYVCKVIRSYLPPILSEISDMISYLPPRLEEASLPEDLLERYSSLNVRAYLIANYLFENCGLDRLPVLYVYKTGDVNAGYVVDHLREKYNLLVFVASITSKEPLIKSLEQNTSLLIVCGTPVPLNEAEVVIRRCSGYSSS